MDKPAILGGKAVSQEKIPILRPMLPALDKIQTELGEVLSTGKITNFSKFVREFEEKTAEYLGVKHCVTLSNGTTGLLLAGSLLKPGSEVLVPSFTFASTVHSLMWNRLTPVFLDIDPQTFNIDSVLIEENISPRTVAILAVHIFGNPCDIGGLEKTCAEHGLKLIFDAAHAFGSLYQGKRIGNFGEAEVFSLSATKVLTTGEGGLLATNRGEIAERIMTLRNYGDPGNYDCVFWGLNGKMTELNAILGLRSLETIEEAVIRRNELAEMYRRYLEKVPGITFQQVTQDCRSTFKDFAILVDRELFGLSRDELVKVLDWENIETKKYFFPPVHRMKAYSEFGKQRENMLPNTDFVSENILCLPMYSTMLGEVVEKTCFAIERAHKYSPEIRNLS